MTWPVHGPKIYSIRGEMQTTKPAQHGLMIELNMFNIW